MMGRIERSVGRGASFGVLLLTGGLLSLATVGCSEAESEVLPASLKGASITYVDSSTLQASGQVGLRLSLSTVEGVSGLSVEGATFRVIETFVETGESIETILEPVSAGLDAAGKAAGGKDEAGNGNGKEKCNTVEFDEMPVSLALVLDRSGSVNSDEAAHIARSAGSLVDELRAGDRVSVVNFNSKVYVDQALTDDVDAVLDAISNPSVESGNSAIWDAVSLAVADMVEETDVQTSARGVILLTDGEDNASSLTRPEAMDQAKDGQVPVFTVGYDFGWTGDGQPDLERGDLQSLASSTGGRYYENVETLELEDIFDTIVKSMGTQYSVCYEAQAGDAAERSVEMEVTTEDGTTYRANATYRVGG